MPSDSSVLMVVVMKDGALVGSEVFPPGTYRLGRGDDMDLRLVDSRVSHHHASFLFTNGQIGIRDEGSQNGILVNGEKVKSARVQPRDEVEIAPFVLKMRLVQKRKDEAGFFEGASTLSSSPREVTAPLRVAPSNPATDDLDQTEEPTMIAAPAQSQQVTSVARAPSPAPPRGTPGTTPVPRGRSPSRPDPAGILQPRPIPRSVAVSGQAQTVAQGTPVPAPVPVNSEVHPPFHTTVTVRRPKGLAVPVPSAPRAVRPIPQPLPPPTDTDLKSGKVQTKPVLRVQLLWGDLDSASIVNTRTFDPGSAVIGGASDSLPIPVYGFPGNKRLRLARYRHGKWQVIVPEGVELLVRKGQGYAKHPVPAEGAYELAEQESAVLRCGGVAVELISELASARIPPSFKPKLERSYWVPMVVALMAIGTMVIWSRGMKDVPDFQPKILPPVRAILQAPKKKKPEPKPEKKEEKIAEKKPEKKQPEIPRPKPPPKPLQVEPPPAAAAVAKLLNQKSFKLLAAVNNIGAKGKMANNMAYTTSGLIGKLPLAMGGPSTLGLGMGRGGGGLAGIGIATLRGAGGMRAGNVGRRGVVGAPVTIPRGGRKVEGTLPMEAVQKVVDAHMGAIRQCYEGALIRNPSISGKVIFEWTIGTDGNVKIAKTKMTTLPGAEVVDCIRSSLVTWHFPAPKGGVVVVSYPFLFNSVGS